MMIEKFSLEIVEDLIALRNTLRSDTLRERERKEPSVSYRSEFERDYSRILYSTSFRRLQEKMQLLGIESAAFYRNRLTHSLEVSRIAHSIAHYVNFMCGAYGDDGKSGIKHENEIYSSDDIALLDAAALAHDIGHPAFGHKGERVLDEIAVKFGLRFEGNAQNYRILRCLDRNGPDGMGLNLTFRTLLAVNKYFVSERKKYFEKRPKKFLYDDDYELLDNVRKKHNLGTGKTLDAQIIELADDIAYATHDLEDGISVCIVTIEEIAQGIRNHNDYTPDERDSAAKLFEKCIADVKQRIAGVTVSNQQQYMHLFRKEMTSRLLDEFVGNIEFDRAKQCLKMRSKQGILCDILSDVTFNNVMRNTNIALYEARGEVVIKSLFNIYSDKTVNKDYSFLPPDYRPNEKSEESEIVRNVIDYIAGMSDPFAIEQFTKYTGVDFNSINVGEIIKINEKI